MMKATTIYGDYGLMRAEALVLIEYLRVVGEPKTAASTEQVRRVIERAQKLQRLGWEANMLAAETQGGRWH
jgi:hypothetical protein